MKVSYLAFALLTSLTGSVIFDVIAHSADSCPDESWTEGNTSEQRFKGKSGCNLSLSPVEGTKKARNYTYSDRGVFSVMNFFSPGDGSRTFITLPRLKNPSAKKLLTGQIEITTASGDRMILDPGQTKPTVEAPQLQTGTNVEIQAAEDMKITPTNHGGVELSLSHGSKSLILDCGFAMGKAAYMNKTGSCTFHDAAGGSCTIANADLFNYSAYDADLKYNDANLAGFLKTRCPKLNSSGLLLKQRQDCESCK